MPSSLPTESTLSKTTDTFGIGTYDSQRDSQSSGEDDEERPNENLPNNGGPLDPFGPDRLLGYPQSYTSQAKHASALLPSDLNRPPPGRRPEEDTKTNPVPSVAQSKLPTDEDNVLARSDYYDDMKIGKSYDSYNSDLWSDEDTGAYASDSIPGPSSNDMTMNNWLGALGNFWSGSIIEDQDVPKGFPSEDFKENVDFNKTNDSNHGGYTMASVGRHKMRRVAIDLELVGELTSSFLKKYGKTNITRRCVTAFLQEEGFGDRQFLASEIVRCLKHRHKVTIADVLDQFPVAKQASYLSLKNIKERILLASCQYNYESDEAIILRRCASNLSQIEGKLEKVNG